MKKDSSDQLFRTPFIRPKILTKVPTQQKYISFMYLSMSFGKPHPYQSFVKKRTGHRAFFNNRIRIRPKKLGSAFRAIPWVPVELGIGCGEVGAEGAPELGGGLQVPAVHHHHPAFGQIEGIFLVKIQTSFFEGWWIWMFRPGPEQTLFWNTDQNKTQDPQPWFAWV